MDPDGFSKFLPDIPSSDGNYEGWQYLGISGILLLLISLVIVVYHLAVTDDWMHNIKNQKGKIDTVLFTFFATAVVAWSPIVYWGSKVILDYSWLKSYLELMSVFRCSGRSFWICTYAILFFSAITVFKRFKKSFPAVICAICIVSVQAYDLSPLIKLMTPITRSIVEYTTPLASEFWEDISKDIDHIYRLSYSHWGYPGEFPLDFYATAHHLTLNNGYIGRNNDAVNTENVLQGIESVVYGTLADDTLYCVEDDRAFTDICLTGENVVELRCDGYKIFIHKDLWARLDQSRYQDIYQECTGEYLTYRAEYTA